MSQGNSRSDTDIPTSLVGQAFSSLSWQELLLLFYTEENKGDCGGGMVEDAFLGVAGKTPAFVSFFLLGNFLCFVV